MKKAIIIGATSGIGQEVAKCLLLDGWQIGVAGDVYKRQTPYHSNVNRRESTPDSACHPAIND